MIGENLNPLKTHDSKSNNLIKVSSMVKLWAMMEKFFLGKSGGSFNAIPLYISHGLYECQWSGCPKKFSVYLEKKEKRKMIFVKKT